MWRTWLQHLSHGRVVRITLRSSTSVRVRMQPFNSHVGWHQRFESHTREFRCLAKAICEAVDVFQHPSTCSDGKVLRGSQALHVLEDEQTRACSRERALALLLFLVGRRDTSYDDGGISEDTL